MMGAPTVWRECRPAPAVLVAISLVFAGCAGYRPPALTAAHPAHPDAPAAREAAASTTLAYTSSDIASIRGASPGTITKPGQHHARQREGAPSKTAVGEGEVVAAVPSSGQIVLEHGEIKGFMEPMTMGYRTDPPSLLTNVKPGDKVRFTIDIERRAIIDLEKLQ